MATYFGFDAYDISSHSQPFVFISYKSEDSERVAVYARYLHDHGINVWYDNGLHAGSDWESYLMSVIESPHCKAVLLFVSSNVASSTVIPLETTQARVCKKPTVAIYLEPGLNLEALLSKAIKVYVDQRQSVNAYIGTENSVCAQVLDAAKMAMDDKPVVTSTSADTLWKNANMFMLNARRSRSDEDINKARGYLNQLTEQEPSDYRGWHGLAVCACLHRVDTPENALAQLAEASKYYSYVVAAGADAVASPEYTDVKTRFWQDIVRMLDTQLELCTSDDEVLRLREKAEPLGKHFGHTQPYVKHDYDLIMSSLNDVLAAAEETNAIHCEWNDLSSAEIALVRYCGSEETLEIPPEVNGKKVTVIGPKAFCGSEKLTAVIIPGTVKLIDREAFIDCISLSKVTMAQGVEKIGAFAFSGCKALTCAQLPQSVSYIEDFAFRGCVSLTDITLPDIISGIGKKPFKGCKKLTVHGRGGLFSPMRKAAKKSRVHYKRIKP